MHDCGYTVSISNILGILEKLMRIPYKPAFGCFRFRLRSRYSRRVGNNFCATLYLCQWRTFWERDLNLGLLANDIGYCSCWWATLLSFVHADEVVYRNLHRNKFWKLVCTSRSYHKMFFYTLFSFCVGPHDKKKVQWINIILAVHPFSWIVGSANDFGRDVSDSVLPLAC